MHSLSQIGKKSLITSILSAGTFFGALIAGDLADWFGRRTTIIAGCFIFIVGVILQTASTALGLLVAGRLIAGFGVGFVSAIIILYMSEIAPKKVRGALVSGYQFCITIGILLASCVDYGTQDHLDSTQSLYYFESFKSSHDKSRFPWGIVEFFCSEILK